jgi:hypothetical protein
LQLGGGEVMLEGVHGGLLLLPHDGSLMLALTGGGNLSEGCDNGGVGHSHIVQSSGGYSRGGAWVSSRRRGGGMVFMVSSWIRDARVVE